jgi:hypothetical protein
MPVFSEHAVFNSQLATDLRVLIETENILNKYLRTADNGWSSSLEVGRSANNSSP